MRKKDKLIHGWGIMDADFRVGVTENGKRYHDPGYAQWKNMLGRCHCPKVQAKHPTYIGCTIDERWRSFMAFRRWREAYATKFGSVDDLDLDKDLLVEGNKVYSPEQCCFVPLWLNTLFNGHGRARGEWPIGVGKSGNRFIAQISINSKDHYLGMFDTPEKAHAVYVAAKAGYVLRLLDERPQPKHIHDAVTRRIENMLEAI